MAVYGSMVLTNLGLALYAKAQAGTTLNFTRMQIGSGSLGATDPKTLTALITPISYFSIISKTSNGNMAVVKGVFDNGGLAASTYSCELGIFAQDPDVGEILYGYVNAGAQGDTIPPISAGPFAKQYQLNAAVGNASSVTATVPAGVYIPTTDMGIANGVATLDGTTHIPVVQLPNVTADPATATAYGISGSITQLFSWVLKYFKAITGNANPFDAPVASLTSLNTNKAPLASPAFTGNPTSTTPAVDDNDTSIATTAFVLGQASSSIPLMDGAASSGTSLRYARANHIHPTDTSRLAVSAYTAADVLGKLLGVDGSGSLLDADMVDGIHFRVNNGVLEWNNGGTWYPVGGATMVASNNVKHTIIGAQQNFPLGAGATNAGHYYLAKFIPQGSGEMVVNCTINMSAPNWSGGSGAALWWLTGPHVSVSDGSANEIKFVLTGPDYRTPTGSIISSGAWRQLGTSIGFNAPVTFQTTIVAREREPVYFGITCAPSGDSQNSVQISNLTVCYDLV